MTTRTSLIVLAMLMGCDDRPPTVGASHQAIEDERCTWGLGYWKNHPEAWPVDTLTLGSLTYSQAQLLDILHQPVNGNGLVSLGHQLVAAKLNLAEGAHDVTDGAIAGADDLVGALVIPPIGSGSLATSETSDISTVLDQFNKGRLEGACHVEVCGDGILDPAEQCDDGNLDNTDACVGTCTNAVCGDGFVYATGGEQCDDGNDDSSDFCGGCMLDNGDGFD